MGFRKSKGTVLLAGEMRALHNSGEHLVNLQFCHCPQFLSSNAPFLIPSSRITCLSLRNLTTAISHTHNLFSPSGSSPSSIQVSMTPSTSSDGTEDTKPFPVLFVCLGNICRSPAAEGVFRHLGNDADPRMRAASKRRGIETSSISRPIQPSDFRDFDLILVMDKQNRGELEPDLWAEQVLDLLQDACESLLEEVLAEHKHLQV